MNAAIAYLVSALHFAFLHLRLLYQITPEQSGRLSESYVTAQDPETETESGALQRSARSTVAVIRLGN